ncbi:tRNA uridine-5-carboxymethylaminomethyl(34) synthesis GTPase MnmE [Jannaschia sp. M317]|uniref:tRNA uridine-5-carboxymethylaminomethyl(34) synthesis GTPase MnmE n=1 Tax=Jannaschia sp. M317 TaxID=2867011 RepID=UPI0021A672DC|nr:tRNA uridine-5-carboxymethylaminomethyl(34) synthesis GTPase MnmE [Jannaschia sp. M317]UWQ18318.1 tRNA uridine-5-carboxymethylaminomethyl(34) synthesis GTPase MnmE [Jannaschia sp. M317]
MSDTIFAQATAPGKAGVSVIRVSGPQVGQVMAWFGVTETPARVASLRKLRDADGGVIDEALVLRFDADASFTGEDVVEFQLHGSIAVMRAMLARLGALDGVRMADPGEFTRRALLNERLDLTEVQGLADIIEAETEVQRREAMRVMSGEMSTRLSGWRAMTIRAMALLEATIDFADEEVPEDVTPEVRDLLMRLSSELTHELAGVTHARSLRSGFEVALVGPPNSGKSSLINKLTSSDVSIISDIPGTTRDIIERAVDVDGIRVVFLDTAGLRETDDPVEQIGVDRAKKRAVTADLRIFLQEDEGDLRSLVAVQEEDIILRSKSDLRPGDISAVTGQGVSELLVRVSEILARRVESAGFVSRQRDELALRNSVEELSVILRDLGQAPVEFSVEGLRAVAQSLHGMIGGVDMEAVLDEIFSSFCLGK